MNTVAIHDYDKKKAIQKGKNSLQNNWQFILVFGIFYGENSEEVSIL